MPFIGGDNLIHVTKLDYIVPVDRPLVELPLAPIGPVEQRIGELCAELIHDGDTLQIGIGAIPDAVLQSLRERKDLGLAHGDVHRRRHAHDQLWQCDG